MARSELRSRREYQNVGTGEPVMCPHCGNTTRRIPRRPLDRVVNVVWDVKRFRCANPMCGWEGSVRMKPKHFPRRPWLTVSRRVVGQQRSVGSPLVRISVSIAPLAEWDLPASRRPARCI